MSTLPKIAPDKSTFQSSLFAPGGTFDGYIHPRLVQGGIKITVRNENYVLNHDGVFCLQTKHNGRNWYSYGGEVNRLTMRQRDELTKLVRGMYKQTAIYA